MPSITVENYIKHIYLALRADGEALLPMGRVASAVGVTPGTATTMIKMLAEAGLVAYEPRGGVRLTRKGEKLALHMVRRHRLVELFLVKVLGLDWSEVHKEAEELEHAISEPLLDKIATYLGHPAFDPHGDPIPTASGTVEDPRHARLADGRIGQPLRVTRVVDQDSRFLRFAEQHGLKPGSRVVIESHDELADSLGIRLKDRRLVTLGTGAAAKILVVPA